MRNNEVIAESFDTYNVVWMDNKDTALAALKNGEVQLSAPAPPAFGTVWYRANFTGYVLNDTVTETAMMHGITPDEVNEYVSTGQYFGGRPLLPGSINDPITVSSSTTNTTILGVINQDKQDCRC